MKEKYPHLNCRAIVTKCREEYGTLDAMGKSTYKSMQDEDKKRFDREVQEYLALDGNEVT